MVIKYDRKMVVLYDFSRRGEGERKKEPIARFIGAAVTYILSTK